jgi:hypothetical protein
VEHEREALRRAERLEHDEQRQADGVGEQRLVLGVRPVRAIDDRVRQDDVERLLAMRATRPQHVQRHAGHDGREPRIEVLDRP